MVRKRHDVEQARKEHDRNFNPDSPDRDVEYYVPSRATDRSRWWRLTENLQKYAAAYVVGATIFSALGFGLITPLRTSAQVTARIDSVYAVAARDRSHMQIQIDSLRLGKEQLELSITEVRAEMAVLIRMGCADRFTPRHDKQLAGLLDASGDCIR